MKGWSCLYECLYVVDSSLKVNQKSLLKYHYGFLRGAVSLMKEVAMVWLSKRLTISGTALTWESWIKMWGRRNWCHGLMTNISIFFSFIFLSSSPFCPLSNPGTSHLAILSSHLSSKKRARWAWWVQRGWWLAFRVGHASEISWWSRKSVNWHLASSGAQPLMTTQAVHWRSMRGCHLAWDLNR